MKSIYKMSVMVLATALATLWSCQKEDLGTPTTPSTANSQEMITATEQVAKAIVGFSDDKAVINEVFAEVAANDAQMHDSQIAFDEFSTNHQQFMTALKKAASPELLNFMETHKMEIYYPYQKESQGTPTITFQPAGKANQNIGYIKDGNSMKQVLVNREYALKKPVWIIKAKEEFTWNYTPETEDALPAETATSNSKTTAFANNYRLVVTGMRPQVQLMSATGKGQFFQNRTSRSVNCVYVNLHEHTAAGLADIKYATGGFNKVISLQFAKDYANGKYGPIIRTGGKDVGPIIDMGSTPTSGTAIGTLSSDGDVLLSTGKTATQTNRMYYIGIHGYPEITSNYVDHISYTTHTPGVLVSRDFGVALGVKWSENDKSLNASYTNKKAMAVNTFTRTMDITYAGGVTYIYKNGWPNQQIFMDDISNTNKTILADGAAVGFRMTLQKIAQQKW